MFNLSQKALKAINNTTIRLLLAQALGVSEMTIIRYINNNDDCLTKAAALEVIRAQTKLKDKEILVRLKTVA